MRWGWKTVALEVSVRVAGFGQWCLKDASQCKVRAGAIIWDVIK